jgi:hypothetical protein
MMVTLIPNAATSLDSECGHFFGQRFRDSFNGVFGGMIDAGKREADLPAHARDVDYVAGSLLTKQLDHSADHIEQPKNIGFELLADLRVADFLNSADEAGSGAVDQHIYTTECVDCGLHGCCHLRKVGYVQAHGATMVRILSLQIGKSFFFAGSRDDPVALGQHCLGQLAAKAGGRAGDKPDT